MRHFMGLQVWERSHRLTLTIYRLRLPSEERYGLQSQLRRAIASVPTNLAEGSKRATQRDFAHFLNLAQSSLSEVEYLLVLIGELGFVPPAALAPLEQETIEISRMLAGLRKRVLQSHLSLAPAPNDSSNP